jgi:hypothetical protein
MRSRYLLWCKLLIGLSALIASGTAYAGEPTNATLVNSLQKGGYVLLMRHASSPAAAPDKRIADKDNTKRERQLDEIGRLSARDMGDTIKKLHIPVGEILSSPTYRALETVKLARLSTPQTFRELGDGGASMSPQAVAAWTSWLKAKVAARPRPGTNTIIVTQMPNIASAFPIEAKGMSNGEALVFLPDAKGAVTLVAHIKIEEWPALAASH